MLVYKSVESAFVKNVAVSVQRNVGLQPILRSVQPRSADLLSGES